MTQDHPTGRHANPDPTGQVPPRRQPDQGNQPPAGPGGAMPTGPGTAPHRGRSTSTDPSHTSPAGPGQPMPAGWEPDQPPAAGPAGRVVEPGTQPPPGEHELAPSTTDQPTVTVRRSRFGGIWVGLIVAAAILILLLVFILQNLQSVQVDFLWMSGRAPVAVAILLGGAAGVLLVAVPGTVRILQLRKNVRHRD